ncbi:chemokine (C-X-C motif) ligand 20 [Labeo rohita]|uniref:chemokine (C-X-C motif) ligand 20 n=1 Tax=Labeo rohita TaxID=84645 RepID=UPI0021E24496|nr:chemokine (C-X-C motif) ligand 20 [Labeo rohita]
MNQVVLILLCALVFGVTLTHSAGQAGGSSQRCLCRGTLLKAVKLGWIRQVDLFPPSPSCSKTEIILTLTGKGKGKLINRKSKVCLDPDERQGQRVLKGKWRRNKKQRNRGRKKKNKKFDDKNGY